MTNYVLDIQYFSTTSGQALERHTVETTDKGYVREAIAHCVLEKAEFSVRKYHSDDCYVVIASAWRKASGEYSFSVDPTYRPNYA
jgi:hypothetical protein